MLTLLRYLGTFFLAALSVTGFAQEAQVSFTEVHLDEANNTIQIVYSLKTKSDNLYNVSLFYSNDGGKTFVGPVDRARVSGDVGPGTEPGYENSIYWNYYYEDDNFTGKNLVFRVIAEVQPTNYIPSLMGPKAALYSIPVPGWGDSKVRTGGKYGLITAGVFGTIIASVALNSSAKQSYINYLNAESVEIADVEYDRAKRRNNTSITLGTVGIAAWAIDVVAVFIKGKKNQRDGLAVRPRPTWHLAVDQVQGKPTAGFGVRF